MKEFYIGQEASLTKAATREAVDAYVDCTGDNNPIHVDEEYASGTIFKECIAHGLFNLGMVSTVIGTMLPGTGAILVNQQIDYLSPIYIGDEITATITIEKINQEKRMIHLTFITKNQNDKDIAEGTSLVKMMDEFSVYKS